MKYLTGLLAIAAVVFALLYFFNPRIEKEYQIEIVKGNEFIINRKVEPVIKLDLKLYSNKVDTVFTDSSGKHNFITRFNIGDDTLGVSGIAEYEEPNLIHKSLAFRYPFATIEKLRIDTMKIKETVIKKGLGYGLHLTGGYDPFLKQPTVSIGFGIHWNF